MVAPNRVGGSVQPVGTQGTKFNPVEAFASYRAEGRRPIPPEYKDLAELASLIQPMSTRERVAGSSPRALASLRDFGGSGFED